MFTLKIFMHLICLQKNEIQEKERRRITFTRMIFLCFFFFFFSLSLEIFNQIRCREGVTCDVRIAWHVGQGKIVSNFLGCHNIYFISPLRKTEPPRCVIVTRHQPRCTVALVFKLCVTRHVSSCKYLIYLTLLSITFYGC